MEMNRTSQLSNNSVIINQVQGQEPLSKEGEYLSALKEWEENAPTGENRTEVAKQLRDCLNEGDRKFELYNSNITELPPLPPRVSSFVIIDCSDFTTWPSNLSQLRKLSIEDCDNFTTVPDNLVRLTTLNVRRCPNFTTMPDDLSQLTVLEIEDCDNLTTLPDNLSELTELYIDQCKNLTVLPDNLVQLTWLAISYCSNFTTVPGNLLQLTGLDIDECENFTTLSDNLSQLTNLKIRHCNNFSTMPNNLDQLTKLEINECNKFAAVPGNLSQLTKLYIDGCVNFTTVPNDMSQLNSLKISSCPNFTTMPDNLPQLTELDITSCSNFTALPISLSHLTKLRIERCDSFTTMSANLSQLTELDISSCPTFTALPTSLSQLTKLRIWHCNNFTTMPVDLSQLTELDISSCPTFTRMPDNLSQLTELNISNCPTFTALPVSLPQLARLRIYNCPPLTRLPNDLPANLDFSGNQFDNLTYVGMWLYIKCAYWMNNVQEIAGFKEYFITRMWKTQEAIKNPYDFKQKQLNLLEQMDNDPELRQACLDLALVGTTNCHDNASAMFQQMQEKALDIAMQKPNVTVNQLINYGLALENKTRLMQLIEDKPELKRGVGGGEGTEAMLALQLLCHQKNITLPIPVTAMRYEPTGWEQFRTPEDVQVTVPMIKYGIGKLIEYVIPLSAKPSAQFLANQPFWQAYLRREDPTLNEKIAVIEITAAEKIDIENDKLFGDGAGNDSYMEIDQNMKAIEQERLNSIARLILDETVRLLG